jgi:hypothetical protein
MQILHFEPSLDALSLRSDVISSIKILSHRIPNLPGERKTRGANQRSSWKTSGNGLRLRMAGYALSQQPSSSSLLLSSLELGDTNVYEP